MITQYTYKLRPAYGSTELLLEFNPTKNINQVVKNILEVFDQLGLKSKGAELLLDDQLINFSSDNGNITLNIDGWDNIFILGEDNQADILKIDRTLEHSDLFKKQKVDFTDYK